MKALFKSAPHQNSSESRLPYAMASRWERIGAWLKKVENQKNLARFTGLDFPEPWDWAIGHWMALEKDVEQISTGQWTLTEIIFGE